jgi:rod shape-determining protein MreC
MRVSRLITNRRLFILLASVIALIVIAGLTFRDRGKNASFPERIVMDIENTVGGWLYRPVSTATGFIAGIHDLHEMYLENARLKSELQNYAWLNSQLSDAKAENARLNQMLGFKNGAGKKFPLMPAHVVGRDPSEWNSGITIDVGLKQGVKADMAVISADGSLVGRVEAAADFSSKVVLITDTQVGDGVSARVQTGQADEPFGIVTGSTTEPGQLEMNFLSPIAQVAPGQMVVTSGLSNIFPKGLLIGRISKVTTGLPGLTQSAIIKPAADLDYLQDVFVVMSGAGS